MTKNWIGKTILLVVVAGMALTGCTKDKSDSGETEAPAPTEPNRVETPAKEEFESFDRSEEGFKVDIPKHFDFVETEVISEEDQDVTHGSIHRFEDETETLEISRLYFPEVPVDEELIMDEISLGQGLEVLRMDHMDTKNGDKIYGVLAHDTATGNYMFYHRIKHGDFIISFLQQRPTAYTLSEEAINKMMLMSLELTS